MTRMKRLSIVLVFALISSLLLALPSNAQDPAPCLGSMCHPSMYDRVLADGEHFPDGFTVPADEVWAFPLNDSATVTSSGNVVVLGRLEMRPANYSINHTLRFTDIDEGAFVGGGTSVIESDVGLWVMDSGILDAVGSERRGWSRKWDATWQEGDEVVRAPHEPGDYFTFTPHQSWERVPQAHDSVLPTELINLTRNVNIEGTPTGRTHVMIHNHTGPQKIRNVAIRYAGVPGALGRYGLHFHHGFDATRGSTVTNVVVRDSGSQAFVPHLSNGITFTNTVAFDTTGPAYWWDAPEDFRSDDPVLRSESHDIVYDKALAARSGQFSDSRSGLRGFALMAGTGNVVRDSVAVGTGGRSNSSGFGWPSNVNHSDNVWLFEDNISHNNKVNGAYIWQNDNNPHIVDRFTTYNNGKVGIEHGAYANPYVYRDNTVLDGIIQHANSRTNSVTGTGSGHQGGTLGGPAPVIYSMLHKVEANDDLLFREVEFTNTPVLELDERIGSSHKFAPAFYFFDRCTVNGRDMEPSDVIVTNNEAGTTVRGVRRDGSTWEVP